MWGVAATSKEITAIPERLAALDIEGGVVTMAAMGTQTDMAQVIVDAQGDYLLPVNGNQGTLQQDIQRLFDGCEADDYGAVSAATA